MSKDASPDTASVMKLAPIGSGGSLTGEKRRRATHPAASNPISTEAHDRNPLFQPPTCTPTPTRPPLKVGPQVVAPNQWKNENTSISNPAPMTPRSQGLTWRS